MNRAHASLLIGLSGAVILAACGGAESAGAKMPAKAAEPPAEEREPTSVAEAQEQIERARTDLEARKDDKKKAEADADSAPEPGAASGATTASKAPAAREETAKAAPADPCAHSCRAISSMRRAVSALCRMTGEEDARCSDAKRTLETSESRVAQCHCGP